MSLCSVALAQTTTLQGKLTNKDGEPLTDGLYTVTFTIYDMPHSDHTLWVKTCKYLPVKNGVFFATFKQEAGPGSLSNGTAYYVGTAIKGQPVTLERHPLVLEANTSAFNDLTDAETYQAPPVQDEAFTLIYAAKANDLGPQAKKQ